MVGACRKEDKTNLSSFACLVLHFTRLGQAGILIIIVHSYSGVNEKIDSGNFVFEIFALRGTAYIDIRVIKFMI